MKLKFLKLRSVAGLVVGAVAIGAASIWFAYRLPAVARLEDPNCLEPADFEKAIVRCTQSKTIGLCDLVKSPDLYNHKIVRVRTIVVGYHHQHLYDPEGDDEGSHTWADYDSPQAADNMIKAIAPLKNGGLERGNIWANVAMIGTFEERQLGDPASMVEDPNFAQIHPYKDRFRFVIRSIEHAEPVGSGVPWPK